MENKPTDSAGPWLTWGGPEPSQVCKGEGREVEIDSSSALWFPEKNLFLWSLAEHGVLEKKWGQGMNMATRTSDISSTRNSNL